MQKIFILFLLFLRKISSIEFRFPFFHFRFDFLVFFLKTRYLDLISSNLILSISNKKIPHTHTGGTPTFFSSGVSSGSGSSVTTSTAITPGYTYTLSGSQDLTNGDAIVYLDGQDINVVNPYVCYTTHASTHTCMRTHMHTHTPYMYVCTYMHIYLFLNSFEKKFNLNFIKK